MHLKMMVAIGLLTAFTLAVAFLLEVLLDESPGRLWIQVVLLGTGGVGIATACLARFRTGRYRFSLWWDFLCLAVFEFGLVSWLLWLAGRLFQHQPFPALLLGILVFFLSINGVAEVLHAGLEVGRRGRSDR